MSSLSDWLGIAVNLATLVGLLIAGTVAFTKLQEGQRQQKQDFDEYKQANASELTKINNSLGVLSEKVQGAEVKAGEIKGLLGALDARIVAHNDADARDFGRLTAVVTEERASRHESLVNMNLRVDRLTQEQGRLAGLLEGYGRQLGIPPH